ncbi:aldehyde dehydrogenase family protein, partial [Aeromicrobium alkaliterrae]|uniref:aldehyde dehydrogenase family protein n=1 Tax=Aeromicrobium alkaliterrae TaxID=302168 RepID=UPI0031DB4AFD
MKLENYVAGWRPSVSGATAQRSNPSDSTVVVGTFQESTEVDVDDAVSAAAEALPRWSATPISVRAAILSRAAIIMRSRSEEIGRCLSVEEGKPLAEGVGEVQRAADTFDYSASFAKRSVGLVI